MNHNAKKSQIPEESPIFVISTRPTRGNSRTNIAFYAILCLALIFFLTKEYGAQLATRIGILLNMLSFLFVSPEVFGINDISKIQNKMINLANRSVQKIIDLITLLEIKRPSLLALALDLLIKPVYTNYKSHDWIDSTESSPILSFLNLLLIWLPPIGLFIPSFSNSAIASYSQIEFFRHVLLNFIFGCVFGYFALLQTLVTVSWHVNAIAIMLHEDQERKFLAILGVWLFVFGEALQFFAA